MVTHTPPPIPRLIVIFLESTWRSSWMFHLFTKVVEFLQNQCYLESDPCPLHPLRWSVIILGKNLSVEWSICSLIEVWPWVWWNPYGHEPIPGCDPESGPQVRRTEKDILLSLQPWRLCHVSTISFSIPFFCVWSRNRVAYKQKFKQGVWSGVHVCKAKSPLYLGFWTPVFQRVTIDPYQS